MEQEPYFRDDPYPDEVEEAKRPRRPFQFRLATIFLMMFLVSILGVAFGGMFRDEREMPRGFFIVLTLIAPIGLGIAFAVIRLLMKRRG